MSSSKCLNFPIYVGDRTLFGKMVTCGNMREIEYRYANGTRQSREFYIGGNPDGIFRWWHEGNGRLTKQVFFRNGVQDGEFRLWKSDGYLFYEDFCQNGKRLDLKFMAGKRLILLRLKQKIYPRSILGTCLSFVNIFLIDDLAAIVK